MVSVFGINEELEVSNSIDKYCEKEGRITRHYPSPFTEVYVCINCGNPKKENGLNTANVQAESVRAKQANSNTLPQELANDKDFCEMVRNVLWFADRLYEAIADNDDIRYAFEESGKTNGLNSFERAVESIDDSHRQALGIFVPYQPTFIDQLNRQVDRLNGVKS